MKDYCQDCGQVEWLCICKQERERGRGMSKLTKRGWFVLVILPALIALWVVWQVAGHLWYVGEGGDFLGYCWGTMEECFKGGL